MKIIESMNFVKTGVNFIDPVSRKTLASYDSFISLYEISSTCDLLMFENGLNRVLVNLVVEGEVKKRFIKEENGSLEKQELKLKEFNTNKGAYETIQILSKTFNSIGEYKYTLDNGEEIDGYDRKLNYDDPFTPIVRINCNNGYVIVTNYKNQIEDIIKR